VGEFRLAVPSGRYSVEVAAAGFALDKKDLTVVSGATARSDRWLNLATPSTSVTLQGSRQSPPAPVAAPARASERVRVGGNVQHARLIRQPKAVYSDELKQLGVEGIVKINAIISKTGSVQNVEVINTVDSRLAAAAVEAVTQWQYEPTRLNGVPVEVMTKIDVHFQLINEPARPRL
jgi:TonB family protein